MPGRQTGRHSAASGRMPRRVSSTPEQGGVVWMVLDGGRLVRFDTTHAGAMPKGVPTLIRQRDHAGRPAAFGGSRALRWHPRSTHRRARCASSSRRRPTSTRPPPSTRSRLDGLDDDWSPWTREARRDYTNLGFGDYRFASAAATSPGRSSEEASSRSRSCRRGTARGGRIGGISLLAGSRSSSPLACSAGARGQGARARAFCRGPAARRVGRSARAVAKARARSKSSC